MKNHWIMILTFIYINVTLVTSAQLLLTFSTISGKRIRPSTKLVDFVFPLWKPEHSFFSGNYIFNHNRNLANIVSIKPL